ncbi:MAG: LTA synthase family protein, partial [Bacteroidia bacterium]|nr:LTA synthase family protein [Bacteroidia bacterium]
FGKGFTGIGGRQSYTPFLDSLMQHSYTFTNAFANAFRSADGIPAILSGIPYMMNDAFPFSIYSTNKIESLASVLKKQGYTSSFFHGGTNGTMNLDLYTQAAGFEKYYGRNEYANDKDYDGTWGIWDEPFLQYFAFQLSKQKQPFISTIFTLSSHEPFKLPPQYQDHPIAQLQGINRGIAYSDLALKLFFEKASKQSWFQNTLFIITADHNFLAFEDPQHYYNQSLGIFAIPIVFFSPNDTKLKANDTTLIQQIDIMPSVLHYLNYNDSFFSFGNSAWDKFHTRFVTAGISSTSYFYIPPMLLTANDTNINGYFNFKNDSLLSNNIIEQKDSQFSSLELRYKAYIQLLHYCLIHNKQSIETFSIDKK